MAEMSERWLANGRQLTVEELNESLRRSRIERSERRLTHCKKSLFWFENSLGLRPSFGLIDMLRQIEANGSAEFYHPPRVVLKPEGGERVIISPKPQLQLLQRRLHLLMKRTFSRPPNVFGYRGGSCLDLVWRHKDLRSTLKFDVKDAFFRVGYARTRVAVRGFRAMPKYGLRGAPGFSGAVSHWVARLCTYTPVIDGLAQHLPVGAYSFLPQGAPTSPICFDLACARLDRKLAKIAKRVGGLMSRYADNYYFSMPTPEFSTKLQAMIVCSVQKRYGFPIHKLRVVDEGELCRILGYNLEWGRVRNTRGFLRKLRGALYVLQTRLDRGLDWEDAYRRIKGFMGFAVDLPDKLQQAYEYCESKIASL